jgi:post-segregation antitoxin (ccd killing protein)
MTEIVTVRIDQETKRKMKRFGISVSKIARAAILREIEAKERQETLEALRRMKEILGKIDVKEVVEDVHKVRAAR